MSDPKMRINMHDDIFINNNPQKQPQTSAGMPDFIFGESEALSDFLGDTFKKTSADSQPTQGKNETTTGQETLDFSKITDGDLPSSVTDTIKSLNTGEHKNETIKIGNYWYRFGLNGNIERIYNHKPQDNINDSLDSFTYITYDQDNGIDKILMYEQEGVKDKDGSRKCNIYNNDGKRCGYYTEVNGKPEHEVWLHPEFDEMTEKIQKGEISLSAIDAYLSTDVNDAPVEQKNDLAPEDNLYLFMKNYENKTGESLLERISRYPDGKDYCKNLIDTIVAENSYGGYKYTADIERDMKSHPSDYKKLSVDLERILKRNPNDSDAEPLNINGEIDEPTKQGLTGNCYLLSSVSTLDSTEIGHKALRSLWHENENGDIEFTCKGNGKTYTITKEDIQQSNYLSHGDSDMRIYELAMDRYRRDLAYEGKTSDVDSDGGSLSDVAKAFFNIDYRSEVTNPNELLSADLTKTTYNFAANLNGANMSVKNTNGETVKDGLIDEHQYQVKDIKDGNIYFVNPWDSKTTLVLSFDEFKKLNPSIESFDLTKLQN